MNILALITDAFGTAPGGIQQFNRDFLGALASFDNCAKIIVLPRHMQNPYTGTISPKVLHDCSGTKSIFHYALTILGIAIKKPNIDLTVCGHINLLPFAWTLQLFTKIRTILIIHGSEAWKPRRRWLVKYFVSSVDILISVSNFTTSKFFKWAIQHIDIWCIPNAVDLERFFPGSKNPLLVDRYGLRSKKVIITVARLSSMERGAKGIDHVLEVLPKVREKFPAVCYLIVGDGSDLIRLQVKTKDLGVLENVVFTGEVPEDEKVDHYRLADAYVMPSREEGFGIVFLEAMACGLPIVTGKFDASREFAKNFDKAFPADGTDKEELLEAILAALSASDGKRVAGLDQFSYEQMEKRVHKLLAKEEQRISKATLPEYSL